AAAIAQATSSSLRSGSTMMASANSALRPRRTLQTWQMRLVCWLRSLIFWSSQKPISRRRWAISGEAESCLIRQAAPTRSLLSGQMKGCSQPGAAFAEDGFLLIVRQGTVIETRLQEGFRTVLRVEPLKRSSPRKQTARHSLETILATTSGPATNRRLFYLTQVEPFPQTCLPK